MRVTHQFVAVLVVLVILQATAGAFILGKVREANATEAEALTRASAIVSATERLESQVNRETAQLLAYFRGAATLEQLNATRTAFRMEADHLAELAEPGSALSEMVQRVRAAEKKMFEEPTVDGVEAYQDETLYSLLHKAKGAHEATFDENTRTRSFAHAYVETFEDDNHTTHEAHGSMLRILVDLERERVSVLEFEQSFETGIGEAQRARDTALELNKRVVASLAEMAISELDELDAELAAIQPAHADEAARIDRLRGNVSALKTAAANLTLATRDGSTETLRDHVEANLTLAEGHGLTFTRGKGILADLTPLEAQLRMIESQQRFHTHSHLLFDATTLLQRVIGGSLGERTITLQMASLEAVAEANREVEAAQAEVAQSLNRARLAIVVATFLVTVPVAVLGGLVVRRLSTRLRSFDEAAAAVSQGRFGAEAPPLMRDDFDPLAKAWGGMTTALTARDRELAAKNEVLRQQERMATLGSLIAGVAHEVNNPLAFVKANEEMALEDLTDLLERPEIAGNEDVTLVLQQIREGIETNIDGLHRIEKTNRALKGFAGPSRDEWETLNVNDVVEGVLILAHNRLKAKYRIERAFGDPVPVRGSSQEIGQVILNLIINAADASEEGSRITIETGERDGHAYVRVRDEGRGVPEDIRENIFTPFFTTKKEGSGLGLHISRNIAENHGGDLALESAAEGSVFTLSLPAENASAPKA